MPDVQPHDLVDQILHLDGGTALAFAWTGANAEGRSELVAAPEKVDPSQVMRLVRTAKDKRLVVGTILRTPAGLAVRCNRPDHEAFVEDMRTIEALTGATFVGPDDALPGADAAARADADDDANEGSDDDDADADDAEEEADGDEDDQGEDEEAAVAVPPRSAAPNPEAPPAAAVALPSEPDPAVLVQARVAQDATAAAAAAALEALLDTHAAALAARTAGHARLAGVLADIDQRTARLREKVDAATVKSAMDACAPLEDAVRRAIAAEDAASRPGRAVAEAQGALDNALHVLASSDVDFARALVSGRPARWSTPTWQPPVALAIPTPPDATGLAASLQAAATGCAALKLSARSKRAAELIPPQEADVVLARLRSTAEAVATSRRLAHLQGADTSAATHHLAELATRAAAVVPALHTTLKALGDAGGAVEHALGWLDRLPPDQQANVRHNAEHLREVAAGLHRGLRDAVFVQGCNAAL